MKRKYDETTKNTQVDSANQQPCPTDLERKYFMKYNFCEKGNLFAQDKPESIERRNGISIKLGDKVNPGQLKVLPKTYKLISFTDSFFKGTGTDLGTLKTLMHALPSTVFWVKLGQATFPNYSRKEALGCFPNWITVFDNGGNILKMREKNEEYEQFVENQLKQEIENEKEKEKEKELSEEGVSSGINHTLNSNHSNLHPSLGKSSAQPGPVQTPIKRFRIQSPFPSGLMNRTIVPRQQVLNHNPITTYRPVSQVPDNSAFTAKEKQAPTPMQISPPLNNVTPTPSLKNNMIGGQSSWHTPTLGQGFLQNTRKSQDSSTLSQIGTSSQKLIFQQPQQYSGRGLSMDGTIKGTNVHHSQSPAFPNQPIHETPLKHLVRMQLENKKLTHELNQANSLLGKSQSELQNIQLKLKEVESTLQLEKNELTITQMQLNVAKNKVKIFKDSTQQAKAEAEQAKAEAEQARAEAQQAKAEAQQAKAEAQQAKAEAEQAKAEAQQAKAEAQLAKNEDLLTVDILMSLDKTDVNPDTQMTYQNPVNSTRAASRASTNRQAFFSFNKEVEDSVFDESQNKGNVNN